MTNLIDEAKQLRAEIGRREKAIMAEEKYLTADKWRYGQILAAIHAEAKKQGKGAWKKALAQHWRNPPEGRREYQDRRPLHICGGSGQVPGASSDQIDLQWGQGKRGRRRCRR